MKLAHRKLQLLSDAIVEIYRPLPSAELPKHFLTTLKRLIPCEHIAYNVFRPESGEVAVTWGHKVSSDLVARLPVFKKYMLENPLVPKLFNRESVLRATRITDVISHKEYQRTRVYNEFYHPVGGNFQMACGLSTKESPFVAIAMNRESADFDEDEVFVFETLRRHIQQALDISQSLESATQSVLSIANVMEKEKRGIVCFGPDYRVRLVSDLAEKIVEDVFQVRPQPGQLLPALCANASKIAIL